MVSEFTAQESYSFHKCLRPEDSDKIISDTYYFLKGHPEQYRSFELYAGRKQSPLSESDFITIMKVLINSVEGDFLRVSIDFALIFTNNVESNIKVSSINVVPYWKWWPTYY